MFLSNLGSIQVHKQSIMDIHTCESFFIFYFSFLCFFCTGKVKNKTERKQLKQKRQKENKEKCFANLKGGEDSHWCNLPKLTKLHGARK
jgi:hypothetical protein